MHWSSRDGMTNRYDICRAVVDFTVIDIGAARQHQRQYSLFANLRAL